MADTIHSYFGRTWAEIATPQKITVDTAGDTPSNDLQLDSGENQLVLSVTADQYTKLLSAALNGANRHYPAEFLNVIYPLIKAGKMAVCDIIDQCIEYHGVMAGRDTLLTIPTVGINVPYTDDAGGRLHDTDGYWAPTKRTQFIVPTGLGGWYRMTLYMLWGGGTGQPRVDIRNQIGAPIYAQEAINLTGLYTSWVSATALLEDNDGVIIRGVSAVADRDIIVGSFEYSTTFHMYRLGGNLP